MLGSGTSQSAAFISGAAALILDKSPEATPDQVKSLLMREASSLKKVSSTCAGAGLPNLQHVNHLVDKRGLPKATQRELPSNGLGSLELARGSDHIEMDGVVLEGEQDIFGQPWDPWTWAPAAAAGTSWSGGDWNGSTWSGTSWSGLSWSGLSWSGLSWSDKSWSGLSWSGLSWSGTSWSGTSWSGRSWSSAGWNASAGLRWD